jgi:uncharacterized membrane protein
VRNFTFIFQFMVASTILLGLADWLSSGKNGQAGLVSVSIALSVYVQASAAYLALRAARGDSLAWDNVWVPFEKLWRYFAASLASAAVVILPALIVLVASAAIFIGGGVNVFAGNPEAFLQVLISRGPVLGLIMLVAVAVVVALSIRLAFSAMFAIDRKTGPIESIKASYRATGGSFGTVFLVLASTVLAIILGMLAFFVGIIVAVPVATIVMARTYVALAPAPGAEGNMHQVTSESHV